MNKIPEKLRNVQPPLPPQPWYFFAVWAVLLVASVGWFIKLALVGLAMWIGAK